MKKVYLLMTITALAFISCENYFDEHALQNNQTITEVVTKYYTLDVNKDYKSVADNKTNKALAFEVDSLANDTSAKTAQTALQAVGKNHYFTNDAAPDVYLPAFIHEKYPHLSKGSMVYITYNVLANKTSARNYTLINADYKEFWNGASNYYVSPSRTDTFLQWLDDKFADVAHGTYMFFTYNYQNIEPLPYVVTIADILYAQDAVEHEITAYVGTIANQAQGMFWLVDGSDSLYVKGLVDQDGNKRNVLKDKNIETGDQITIHATYDPKATDRPTLVNAVYVSHVKAGSAPRRAPVEVIKEERTELYQYDLAAKHWNKMAQDIFLPASVYESVGDVKIADPATVIDIYLRDLYPYAVKKDAYLVAYYDGSRYILEKYIFDGMNFVAESPTEEETMAFEIKDDMWQEDVNTFFKQAVKGDEDQGKLVIVNVDLGPLDYIWTFTEAYGMKGTTYLSGPHAGEGWFVTPAIKLKKAIAPSLNFDHAINYGPQDENREEEMSVWVSTSFDGATINPDDWTRLPWNKFDEETSTGFPTSNSWTFYNSGEMDLSPWVGQTIYIGWRYKALEGWTCSTWEVQNILVHETAKKEE